MSKVRNLAGGGQVFFCPGCDSTHAVNTKLAGQTVEIPEWPHAPGTYGGIEG